MTQSEETAFSVRSGCAAAGYLHRLALVSLIRVEWSCKEVRGRIQHEGFVSLAILCAVEVSIGIPLSH
jgi:hypothetical protein